MRFGRGSCGLRSRLCGLRSRFVQFAVAVRAVAVRAICGCGSCGHRRVPTFPDYNGYHTPIQRLSHKHKSTEINALFEFECPLNLNAKMRKRR